MECLGSHNKPKAEVHTVAIMLTGPTEEEEEEEEEGNSPLNACTRGWEYNIKTYLKDIDFGVVRMV
jgi:hypothetical protein